MKTYLSALALLATLLAACTSGPIYLSKIEDILSLYGTAIRWGDFEKAQTFQAPAKRTHLDLDWLKNIHVASYDIINQKESQGGHIHEVTVKIRYFIESEGVEKTLTDKQLWRYDEDSEKLTLESDLPAFR